MRNKYYICIMNKELLIEYVNQGLSTWKLAEQFKTTQPNIRYWLKKFDLNTKAAKKIITNKTAEERICPKCKINKNKTEFYSSSTKNSSYCKSCIVISNKEKQIKFKEEAVLYKGGKCVKCGYNKCLAALDFHHLDPTTKDSNWNNWKRKFTDKIKKELDKCILLCANCHREEHYLS